MQNVNSTSAYSAPFLIMSFSTFLPKAIFTEPRINDFPAPVSPVKTTRPFVKSTSTSFINAKFFTCKLSNIFPPSLHISPNSQVN